MTAILTLIVAVVVWQFLLPPQFGGRTMLVVAKGSSMEPDIREGDLAAVRRGNGPFRAGDVVLYRSRSLNQHVLHRIERVQADGRLVLKGDNNDFLDPDRPTADAVVGAYKFHVAGLGRLPGASSPVAVGLFTAAGFLLVVIGASVLRRSAARDPRPRESGAAAPPASMAVGAAVAGIFALGVMVAWLTPIGDAPVKAATSSKADPARGRGSHDTRLRYEARVDDRLIEPSGTATTGDAVFVDKSGPLVLRARYDLRGTKEARQTPVKASLVLVVDDQAGWSYEQSLAKRSLETASGEVSARLDLKVLSARLKAFERATRTVPANYRAVVLLRVQFPKDAPKPLAGVLHEAKSSFTLEGSRFRPAVVGPDAAGEFEKSKAFGGGGSAGVKKEKGSGGLARSVALVAGVLTGVLLLVLMLTGARPEDEDQAAAEEEQEGSAAGEVQLERAHGAGQVQQASGAVQADDPGTAVQPERPASKWRPAFRRTDIPGSGDGARQRASVPSIRELLSLEPIPRADQAEVATHGASPVPPAPEPGSTQPTRIERRSPDRDWTASEQQPGTCGEALEFLQSRGTLVVPATQFVVNDELHRIGSVQRLLELAEATGRPILHQRGDRRERLLVRDETGACWFIEFPAAARRAG